jgi:hypothetical protein
MEEIVVGFPEFNSSKMPMGAGRLLPIDGSFDAPLAGASAVEGLRLAVLQNPRCLRRLWLKPRYSSVVFGGEIQESFLGEGVRFRSEATAAFRLFF